MMYTRIAYVITVIAFLSYAWPAEAEQYLALRFSGSKAPGAYMRIEKGSLRIAPTVAKTKDAPVLWSGRPETITECDGRKATIYTWDDIDLTSYMDGRGKLQTCLSIKEIAAADAQKNTPPDIDAQLWGLLRARDKAGTMWAFRFYLAAPGYLNSDPLNPQVIRIPVPGPGKLEVDTIIRGHDARIGARLMMDDVWLISLQKGGASGYVAFTDTQKCGVNAAVRLDVRDSKGNLVHAQNGDLGTFSYTWGDMPVYLLVLDKDGKYTVKMTLDYPGGKITGKTSFTIPGKAGGD